MRVNTAKSKISILRGKTASITVAGFLVATAALFLFYASAPIASAASELKSYSAIQTLKSGGSKIEMKPGEKKSVSVQFQNTGKEIWKNEGVNFVSVYTYEPKYRESSFVSKNWINKTQPARMQEKTVSNNSVASFSFELVAPTKAGEYKEQFKLAAEDKAWIEGGAFYFNIVVSDGVKTSVAPVSPSKTSAVSAPVAAVQTPAPSTSGYLATILLRSAKKIVAGGGADVAYTIGIKNIGTKSWVKREVRVPDVKIATLVSDLYSPNWKDTGVLIAKESGEVVPGSLEFYDLKFKAPRNIGSQVVRFVLVSDGVAVTGGEIDIPIDVTSNAPDAVSAPVLPTTEFGQMIEEPIIRVGILIVDEETQNQVEIISKQSDVELRDETGALLAEIKSGVTMTAFYKNGSYQYNVGRGLEKSSFPLRFIPKTKNAVLTIVNFDRRLTRDAQYADNAFRNILELRYNSAKDRTWIINELPMEMYLRGLAETSDLSPSEFHKTVLTAARAYALYHFERASKHKSEGYHVDAYKDQVYRGYGQEERTPKITQAVNDTRGIIVNYDGKTAITPYFSRSDGRTRDWFEVWGGDVAWLKSVPTPCDKGKILWGHGVGMSASEALCQAKSGKKFEDILKYFYRGVSLAKRW